MWPLISLLVACALIACFAWEAFVARRNGGTPLWRRFGRWLRRALDVLWGILG